MTDHDPVFDDDPKDLREEAKGERQEREARDEGREPVGRQEEEIEPERALGGVYLVLIVLAVVILAVALLIYLI